MDTLVQGSVELIRRGFPSACGRYVGTVAQDVTVKAYWSIDTIVRSSSRWRWSCKEDAWSACAVARLEGEAGHGYGRARIRLSLTLRRLARTNRVIRCAVER